MKSTTSVVIASIIALVVTTGCGGSQSPTMPSPFQGDAATPATPAPAPVPVPAPAPTPAPLPSLPPAPIPSPGPGAVMAFTPDTTAPAPRSFSMQPSEMNGDDIYVGLHATDFGKDAVNMARATISYDPAVVSLVSFSSADSWMSSFGYQPTFSVSKSGANQIKVRVDIPSTSAGASGSGRILRLRFRKVSAGTSRLEFVEGRAYDSGYNDSLQVQYGGTMVVK